MRTLKRWMFVVLGPVYLLAFVTGVASGWMPADTGPSSEWPAAGASQQETESRVTEILVKFKPDVSEDRIRALVTKHSASIKEVIKRIETYVLNVPEGREPAELVEALSQEPEVEYAELQGSMEIQ